MGNANCQRSSVAQDVILRLIVITQINNLRYNAS